jgi:hypothetical protein
VLLPVPGYREGLGRGLVLGGLRGGVPDDPFPAGGYSLLVEPLGDGGLDGPGQAEGGGAAAFPGAWGFSGAGVVGHGARAAGGVAAGDVGDVVAGFHVGFNGHGGPPLGCGARWSGHGYRVMHRYKRFGLQARAHA